MFGKLSAEEIEEVLNHQIIGRIGCHADGLTYVVPVSFAYDGVYVYVRTFEGLKLEMMRKNAQVCLQVDILENMANWKSVIAWGEFEELPDVKERNKALQKLIDRTLPMISSQTAHLSAQWPFPEHNIEKIEGIVFRIRLDRKTGRFEKNLPDSIYAT